MSEKFAKKRISLFETSGLKKMLRSRRLHTVCESALCPNIGECFARKTATFLICGDTCTRGCGFCGVGRGVPAALDDREPERVSSAVRSLRLKYVVITSVTRDDLPDGGAAHFAATVKELRENAGGVKIELLVPDFQGEEGPARIVIDSKPDIFSHNVETVPSLYATVRRGSDYGRSLRLLESASGSGLRTKSGLMLGLGETRTELLAVLKDLRNCGCSILTLGQYLAPTGKHIAVNRYYSENEFTDLKNEALAMGFANCASAPYVRSSYLAEQMI